jgi:RloB-like protein
VAITSWPCFEIWVLLHFHYTTAPVTATGNKSAGDKVLAEVVKRMGNYTKGDRGIFEALAPRLSTALANAKRLRSITPPRGQTILTRRCTGWLQHLLFSKRPKPLDFEFA